ncbi:MAG: hypothetical protein MUF87_13400 [Anaerolineae bacterium]|jgi:hypothetical protein|nr:hypothetical protein [Anaerolineae bacterium]
MSSIEFSQLSQATGLVKQYRSPLQYTNGEQLIRIWSTGFEIDPVWIPHSISLCLGIDDLFEKTPFSDLPALQQRLNALVGERVITWDSAITTLNAAIEFYLVFFNRHASDRLSSHDVWFDLWHHSLDRHHTHQIAHQAFVGDRIVPEANHLEAAIEEYLARFEYTAGFSLNVLSLLPFSPRYESRWLEQNVQSLRLLDQLYRVAQDVRVDLNESLNLGIFVYAAQHRLDSTTALQRLQADPDQVVLIKSDLDQHFEQRLNRCQTELQTNDPIWQGFIEQALHKVRKIRGKWR